MIKAQLATLENPFEPANRAFNQLRRRLDSAETMRMTHAEVEALVETDGCEVLRQLLQSHLRLRAQREDVHEAVAGADGVVRTHHRHGERQLETLFGTVAVERMKYAARGQASLMPLDAELNLPPTLFSDGVERRAAEHAAQSSFDEVVHTVRSTSGAVVAKRQVEEIAVRAAADFDAFYDQREVAVDDDSNILVLSFDGKGVVMRREHLRPATAKAVDQRTRKLSRRLSKGEKRSLRRMATVAALYSVAPFVRKPEQIVREMQPVHEVPPTRPRPQNKRVSASVEKRSEDVVLEFFDEALRRDPDKRKDWVVLVDGAEAQLVLTLACADAVGVDVVVILDIIHVLEYLWSAAFCFHAEGSAEAEQWVSRRLLEILRGNASRVAGGMRRSATRRGLRKGKRAAVDKCADYLCKYSEFLRYDRYLAAGYPISTGVIEGACRYLVKDRMDITGARWGLQGAEAVLKLRALRASGDFDAYWAFHQRRQYDRHHRHLYPNQQPPPATHSTPEPRRTKRQARLEVVR